MKAKYHVTKVENEANDENKEGKGISDCVSKDIAMRKNAEDIQYTGIFGTYNVSERITREGKYLLRSPIPSANHSEKQKQVDYYWGRHS